MLRLLHKQLKKRLSSCLAAVLAATCMFSSIPVSAAGSARSGSKVNLASGIVYETNATSSDYNEAYPDFDHVKMTDGQKASSVWASASVGFKNLPSGDPLTLTFDLGGEKDIMPSCSLDGTATTTEESAIRSTTSSSIGRITLGKSCMKRIWDG